MKTLKFCAILLTAAFLMSFMPCAPVLSAQTTTGTLLGTVLDQQNDPLPGVLVQVVNLANNFGYSRRTDAGGTYRIDFLPPGEYAISAAKDGFQPNSIPRYLAEVNREKVVKPPPIRLLPIAAPTPPAPPPNTPPPGTQANVADVTLRGSASSEFITALPLAGIRSFDTFALLVPGVSPPPATLGASGPGIGAGVGTSGQFSVNGQRARSNNFTIDGSDNNDQDVGVRRQGFTPSIPQSVESITEFQISTLLADAEAGRNLGGQVNIVSKSGSNELHGEFYDFITDSSLNARDAFDQKGGVSGDENPYTRNQVGATIGFPIIKSRLNFFGSFERQDVNRAQETHFSVPSASERAAALNRGRNNGSDVLALFPLPNNPGGPYGSNSFTKILPANADGTIFSVKADYQFKLLGRTSLLTGRYNFTDDDTLLPTTGDAVNSSIDAKTRTQNAAFTLNTEISERLSNQVRFSYGRTALEFDEVSDSPFIFQSRRPRNINDSLIIRGQTGPVGRILLAPYSSLGVDPFLFPQGRANNTFQIADTLVFTRGRNTLKAGFDIRRVQFNSFLDRNYRAQVSFTPNLIGSLTAGGVMLGSGADFAGLGLASDIFQAIAVTPDSTLGLRFTESNFFAHDTLNIYPRVALEFGLRYERNTVPTDKNKRIENALKMEGTALTGGQTGPFIDSFLSAFAAQRRFVDGRDKIYEPDNDNFAPRIGIAIDLTGKGRTSLRAGYGIFYDPLLGNIVSQSRNVFPAFIPVNFGYGVSQARLLASNPSFIAFGDNRQLPLIQPNTLNTLGLPAAQTGFGLGQLISVNGFALGFTLPEKNLRTPYVQQYSLSLEQALQDRYVASVAYVGTKGRKLIRFRTPNGGQFTPIGVLTGDVNPFVTPFFGNGSARNPRPESALGSITVFESSANSDYHSLQASLVKRSVNGFGFQLAYAYSHAIDDVSDVFDLAGSFAMAQDELGRREGISAERGSASFDIRHRFTAGWQLELPLGAESRILKGFQLSGILALQTGQPFTVNTSFDSNMDGNLTDRLNTTVGLRINDGGATRITLAPGATPLSLLAVNNSSRPIANGAVGRNTFRAQGTANIDIALDKRFAISDSQSVKFRVEVFNLFNRTHFAIPVRVLESPGFGSSVSTALPARTVQFALRYSF